MTSFRRTDIKTEVTVGLHLLTFFTLLF